jgi:hypothetical protein
MQIPVHKGVVLEVNEDSASFCHKLKSLCDRSVEKSEQLDISVTFDDCNSFSDYCFRPFYCQGIQQKCKVPKPLR